MFPILLIEFSSLEGTIKFQCVIQQWITFRDNSSFNISQLHKFNIQGIEKWRLYMRNKVRSDLW